MQCTLLKRSQYIATFANHQKGWYWGTYIDSYEKLAKSSAEVNGEFYNSVDYALEMSAILDQVETCIDYQNRCSTTLCLFSPSAHFGLVWSAWLVCLVCEVLVRWSIISAV